jgi:hypothetical protein
MPHSERDYSSGSRNPIECQRGSVVLLRGVHSTCFTGGKVFIVSRKFLAMIAIASFKAASIPEHFQQIAFRLFQ